MKSDKGGNGILDIEEATEVLSEAIITEPSIKSYVYISAGEINEAIDVILRELQKKEETIKQLNDILNETLQEKSKTVATGLLERLGKSMFLEKSI
ncbi:MAG: hypothetical protein ACI4U9_05420 [Clostridia bacterium]